METQLFSTKDAAVYLGLSRQGLWYHITNKHIFPWKIGNSLVFTQAQLEKFDATRRGPGRPKIVKEEIPDEGD